MKKTILIFSSLIVALLILFKVSSYTMMSGDLSTEFAIAGIAVVFFFVGVFIHKKSLNQSRENREEATLNLEKVSELGISNREYEVLEKISAGLSNKEIAEALFVSESTIKTHVSSVLLKLDAKRRTQAIRKAKALNIIH